MFTKIDDTRFMAVRGEFHTDLPPNAYRWDEVSQGMIYKTDELQREFPTPFAHQQTILDRIEAFMSSAEGYARLGITYKRGFLLHGGPGCGKTTIARMAARLWIQRGGAVLTGGPQSEVSNAIKMSGKRTLVLIDDVDEWNDAPLTHAMDGLGDVSNVLWLATTNKINEVSGRLQRPGRFDEVLEIQPPPEEDILKWVRGLDIADDEKNWVIEHAPGLTPSEVRELVIRVHLLGERRPIYETTPDGKKRIATITVTVNHHETT